MCEALNISKAVARRAEAPGSRTAGRTSDKSTSQRLALSKTKLRKKLRFRAMKQVNLFFLLHAAKVRSSCEEGPGQSALQSAYHDPKLDVTELKQHRTP